MNNGKKKGRGPNLGPSPHLESSSYELLAQSRSTFESSQLDEIHRRALEELLRCEIQNSVAIPEVCWD